MVITLDHRDGFVFVEELPDGRRHLAITMRDPDAYVSKRECESVLPVDVLRAMLEIKGPAYLCNEISRDEQETSVPIALRYALLGYLDEACFESRQLLDFGCGSGASTMALARMLPQTSIIGVDLDDHLLTAARLRAEHYGFANVRFAVAPSGDRLPAQLGTFDYIVLSAVYEHLLPHERTTVLPMLWHILRPGGVLFLNQTPHRWFPVDIHTTGLLGINFLPDRLALEYARKCSRRVGRNESWESLLRHGIRGATEREVLSVLDSTRLDGTRATLMRPCRLGLHDSIDLWQAISRSRRNSRIRRAARPVFKILSRLPGGTYCSWLFMAIRNDPVAALES